MLYPPGGRWAAEVMSACSTSAGLSAGYRHLISAATPLTSAAAGLVPSASMYSPPGPAPSTATPGAETTTELFCSEKEARAPLPVTAATAITPVNDAG